MLQKYFSECEFFFAFGHNVYYQLTKSSGSEINSNKNTSVNVVNSLKNVKGVKNV